MTRTLASSAPPGTHLARRHLLALGSAALATALWTAAPAWAQKENPETYQPQSGQAGKDVIWVPTPDELVTRMLQLGGVTKNDYVIDLGAGDGKIVIAAAKEFGARGHGIEYNPDMVAHATRRAQAAGVADRARFEKADIFESDFSKADVITMYLLPTLNLKLRPTLMKLKPGTRLVTHAFTMGGWQPDETSRAGGANAYLWLVPANVSGQWQLSYPQGGRQQNLALSVERQRYQFPEDTVQLGAADTSLRDARVMGERVRFAFTGTDGVLRTFEGKVNGGKIEGQVHDGKKSERFTATRKGDGPAIEMAD